MSDSIHKQRTPRSQPKGKTGKHNSKASTDQKVKIETIQELFPDWTEEDLAPVLEEYHFEDVSVIIEHIISGKIHKWDQVKKEKKPKKEELPREQKPREFKPKQKKAVRKPIEKKPKAAEPQQETNSESKPESKPETLEQENNVESVQAEPEAVKSSKKMSWAAVAAPPKPKPVKPVKQERPEPVQVPPPQEEAESVEPVKSDKEPHVEQPVEQPIEQPVESNQQSAESTLETQPVPQPQEKEPEAQPQHQPPVTVEAHQPPVQQPQQPPVVLPYAAANQTELGGISFGSLSLEEKEPQFQRNQQRQTKSSYENYYGGYQSNPYTQQGYSPEYAAFVRQQSEQQTAPAQQGAFPMSAVEPLVSSPSPAAAQASTPSATNAATYSNPQYYNPYMYYPYSQYFPQQMPGNQQFFAGHYMNFPQGSNQQGLSSQQFSQNQQGSFGNKMYNQYYPQQQNQQTPQPQQPESAEQPQSAESNPPSAQQFYQGAGQPYYQGFSGNYDNANARGWY